MEIPTHKYKKSRVHKEYNDESIYNMYIQLYRSGIKNNRDSKYLNAIQKEIPDFDPFPEYTNDLYLLEFLYHYLCFLNDAIYMQIAQLFVYQIILFSWFNNKNL